MAGSDKDYFIKISEPNQRASIPLTNPFQPLISKAQNDDFDVTGVIYSFNQAYIYNIISSGQYGPAKDTRKIENMDRDFEVPLNSEFDWYVEVRTNATNNLIAKATFTGFDIKNDGPPEINNDFPHIQFDDTDEDEVLEFTGYYPICETRGFDLTRMSQRGDIILSNRQFHQKGAEVEGQSALILVESGHRDDSLPVRVKAIAAGTGIYVETTGDYIVIHATGTGATDTGTGSCENIGTAAEVYKDESSNPFQFRTLRGSDSQAGGLGVRNNVTVTRADNLGGGSANEILISGGCCENVGSFVPVYVEESIRDFQFRSLEGRGTVTVEQQGDTHIRISGSCCDLQTTTDYGSTTTNPLTFGPTAPATPIGSYPVSIITKSSSLNALGVFSSTDLTDPIHELQEDSSNNGENNLYDSNGNLSARTACNTSKEGIFQGYNAAGGQVMQELGGDGAGNPLLKQTNAAGTVVNQIAGKSDTDTYFDAGPVAIGDNSTVAGKSLYVKGTTRIQDSSTAGDGKIELGNDATHSIGYSSSKNALNIGAGVTKFDADHSEYIDFYSTNAASYSAQDAYIIGSSPATGSAILAGSGNSISGHFNSIVAGANNLISGIEMNLIGGGSGIDIIDSRFCVSVGGQNNDITGSDWSVIGGGYDNIITGRNTNSIGGGYSNEIKDVFASVIAGGHTNKITGKLDSASAVAGGISNTIAGSTMAFIGAGGTNTIHSNSDNAVIVGGVGNEVNGINGFIGGGQSNAVSGTYGVALGSHGKVQEGHNGAFVFSDGSPLQHYSSGSHTLLAGFQNGVYIQSNSGLYVNGEKVITTSSEADTLQTVTDRGATTTNNITLASSLPKLFFQDTDGTNQIAEISKAGSHLYFYNRDNVSNGGYIFIGDNGTTDTEFMRIETDGDVGIGSNAPSAKLDVAGGIKLLDNNYLTWNGSNTRIVGNSSYLQFQVAASDKVRIQSDGSVGIGTTAPITRLVVDTPMNRGQTNPSGLIVTDSANGAMALEMGVDRASSASYIESRHTGSNTNYTLLLNPSYGKVGVGTTSPTSKFEVGTVAYGTNSIAKFWDGTDGVEITNRGSSRQQIDFLGSNTSAINAKGSLFINYDSDNGGSNDNITFARNGVDEAGTVDMIITEGQVGIGVTNPAHKLVVSGDVGGTGDGGRITLNGTGYLLSGEAGTEADTLQSVTDRGATTTNSIFVEGTGTFHSVDITGSSTLTVSGNAGIGITDPDNSLTVAGTGIFMSPSADTNNAIRIGHSSSIGAGGSSQMGLWAIGAGKMWLKGYSDMFFGYNKDVTIKDGGKVGIGTTNPDVNLTVRENDTVGPTIGLHNSEYQAWINSWGSTASAGRQSRFEINAGATDFAAGGTTIRFQTPNVGDSNERMRIDADGNVGIGTTDPQKATHLYVTGNDGLRIQSSNNHAFTQIMANDSYSSYIQFRDGANRYWIQSTTDDKLRFRPNATSLESATINFDATGNLGVGTNSPQGKLQVNTKNHNTFALAIGNDSYTGGHPRHELLMLNDGSLQWYLPDNGSTPAKFQFYSRDNSDFFFTADSDTSRVGIGISSPSQTLHVKGIGMIEDTSSTAYGTLQFGTDASRYIRGNSAELQAGPTIQQLHFQKTNAVAQVASSAADGTDAIQLLARTVHTSANILEVVNGNGAAPLFTIDYAGNVGALNSNTGVNVGTLNNADGKQSVALGYDNDALGVQSVAVGYGNQSTGNQSTTFGNGNSAAVEGTAIGAGSHATASRGTAVGRANSAAQESTAVGYNAQVAGIRSIGIGRNVTASAQASIAIGDSAVATGSNTISIGLSADAGASRSTAVGYDTTVDAVGLNSMAFGYTSRAAKSSAGAFGYEVLASGEKSFGFGYYTTIGIGNITEVGQFGSDRTRKASVRINGGTSTYVPVAITMHSGTNAPSASSAAAGYEDGFSLGSDMYSIQRNGADYILYHNLGGSIQSTTLGAAEADTLQTVTDRGNTTTNNMEIQGAGSKSFTVDSTNGHASVVIDRHSTSYDANLSFQTNGATKWRLWNNSNDSTFSIRDEVNASNVMTWEVGGNVGIGTDDPDHTLHVEASAGSAKITSTAGGPNLYLEGAAGNLSRIRWNSASGNFAIRDDTTASDRLMVTSDGDIVSIDNKKFKGTTYTSSYIKFSDDTTLSANSDIIFDVNGSTELMRLEEGGNVGIGTSAPVSNFTVYSSDSNSATASIHCKSNNATGALLRLVEGDNHQGGFIQYDGNNNKLNIGVHNTNDTTFANDSGAITIDRETAKVGIGTTTTSAHLTIANTDPKITLYDTAGANSDPNGEITFNETATSENFAIKYNGANDRLEFNSPLDGNTGIMVITRSERVGIGTTGPNQLLHVDGKTQLGTNGFSEGGLLINYASLSETKGGAATLLGNAVYAGTTSNTFRRTKGDAGNYILMTYNRGIAFHTNVTGNTSDDYSIDNHEQMRITTGGFVGIGTTDPLGTTHIYTADAGGTIATNASHDDLIIENNGNCGIQLSSPASSYQYLAFGDTASANQGYVRYYHASDRMDLRAGGTDTLSLVGGYVGIGTTDPDAPLHIKSTTNIQTLRVNSAWNEGAGAVATISTSANGNVLLLESATTSSSREILEVKNSNGAIFDILGNGHVGIGTNVPSNILHVKAEKDGDYVARITNTETTTGANFGLKVDGGSNSSDVTFEASSLAGTSYFQVRGDGNVGIGSSSPSYELDVNGTTRSTYYIGGAYLEENASSSKLKFYTDGTVLVMDEDGELKPCEKENDTLVFGVTKADFDSPVVLGAEPILVTGPIKVGDYIVTSSKQGHGQAMKEEKLGTIIAQAMESGDGESYNIKAMIRKM